MIALPRTNELQEYCNWAYRYYDVTAKIDWSNFESVIPSLEIAAQIAKRWAEGAPQEVRVMQHELVASDDEFIARLKQRAPKTTAEFRKAVDDAQIAIKKKYSNLDHDTEVVKAFDHTNCGVDNG